MSSKATNLLTGNAEQSAVYRSSEGKNQGKTTYIVLTISRVRSAVYRSKHWKAAIYDRQIAVFFFVIGTETGQNEVFVQLSIKHKPLDSNIL